MRPQKSPSDGGGELRPLLTDEEIGQGCGTCRLRRRCGANHVFYRLNRRKPANRLWHVTACHRHLRSLSAPLYDPGETACHMRYRMRSVACATDPGEELAFSSSIVERRTIRPSRDLCISAALAGLVAMEVIKHLTAVGPATSKGRIVVVDPLELSCEKHQGAAQALVPGLQAAVRRRWSKASSIPSSPP